MSPRPRPIDPADLTEDVVLVYPSKASDGAGGTVVTMLDGETVRAAIVAVSGHEMARAGLIDVSDLHRGRIRYRADITREWQLRRVRDSKVFEIAAPPREVDRQRWLELDLVGRP